MSPRRRRRSSALTLLVITLLLSSAACQRGRVGQRCRTKDFGDDGGAWVLVCRNGRWVRALTKTDAAKLLIPPTTASASPSTSAPPSTAPVPPLRSFGPGAHAVATNGQATSSLLGWGIYAATEGPGQTCNAGTPTTHSRGRLGIRVIRVSYGANQVVTEGPCTWTALDAQDPTYGGNVFTQPAADLEFPGGPGCNLESLKEPYVNGYDRLNYGTLGPVVRSVGTFDTSWGPGGVTPTDPRPFAVIARGCGVPTAIGPQAGGVHLTRGNSGEFFWNSATMDWMTPRHAIGLVGTPSSVTLTFGAYTAEISFLGAGMASLVVSGCNTAPSSDLLTNGGYSLNPVTGNINKVFGLSLSATCTDGTRVALGASVG